MDVIAIALTLILLLIPTLLLIQRIRKHSQLAAVINRIPGPQSYPIIGTVLEFWGKSVEDIFPTFLALTRKFWPGPFRIWNGLTPMVALIKAEHIELIVSNQKHITKGLAYRFLVPWLGTGLLIATGTKWHSRRKIITPAFHFKILDIFLDVFTENSEILLKNLKGKENGTPFNIYPYITRCALDMICETAMGVRVNAQQKTTSEYVNAIYKFSELTTMRFHKPWFHSDFLYDLTDNGKETKRLINIMHNFTSKVIKEKRQCKGHHAVNSKLTADDEAIGTKKRLAFLDMLLEATIDGQPLTDEDIREETDTFMFEGHDTTTAGISWVLLVLGHYPEIQARVHEELDSLFDNENQPITKEDTANMKYLEMVIKETLRLYPSVPGISRTLGEDIKIDGYLIPKDTVVSLSIYACQRDPEHFANPEQFNPDNFLPDNIAKRHPYAFMPFSAGARNCIGQKFALLEEKVVLASILRKYVIKSVEPLDKIPLMATLILRPGNGVHVSMTPRKRISI